jgi:CHAD domain-containing protein
MVTQGDQPLRHAVLNLLDSTVETLTSSRSDESVHAARKSAKRIRAALRLMRDSLGRRAYRRENGRVRDAAKPLTGVRDAFMLRKHLRSIPARSLALHQGLDAEYHRERDAVESQGWFAAVARLRAARVQLAAAPALPSEGASAIAGVRKSYKAGRKACARARPKSDRALHEWRKQTKYLLNQLEVLRTVFNVELKKFHRRADELADILGDDHDLGVLLSKARRYDATNRRLAKHIKSRRHKLQARALQLGEKLYRRSTKRICRLLAAKFGVDAQRSAGSAGAARH